MNENTTIFIKKTFEYVYKILVIYIIPQCVKELNVGKIQTDSSNFPIEHITW